MTLYGLLGEQAALRRTCLSLFRREYFLNTNLVNQMLTRAFTQFVYADQSGSDPGARELFTRRDTGHVCKQWPCSHAACFIRVSISLRSIPKSIGLVNSASAPFSNALRFVSASP